MGVFFTKSQENVSSGSRRFTIVQNNQISIYWWIFSVDADRPIGICEVRSHDVRC